MASERASGGLGGRLREVRERRGITLRQIANATKISVRSLEALERNDISGLPGGIFSRAFVRAYAVEVGLDPEEMIQEFITQFPDESVTAGQRAWAQIDDSEEYESNRRTAAAFARLIAVSVPIAAVVLYFSTGSPNTPDENAGSAACAGAGGCGRAAGAAASLREVVERGGAETAGRCADADGDRPVGCRAGRRSFHGGIARHRAVLGVGDRRWRAHYRA